MPTDTILLVGGAGYVGSAVGPLLLEQGRRIRVVDALIYGNSPPSWLNDSRVDFRLADLRNSKAMIHALDGMSDVVLLASLVGDPICRKFPELAVDVNVTATHRLIDSVEASAVQRFVFLSTCSNYGLVSGEEMVNEDSPLNPLSLYAETKIEIERSLSQIAAESRFAPVTLRLATAFGISPRMRFDLTVSQFTYEMVTAGSLLVYDADTWRPYCHIRDIARAVAAVLDAPVSKVRGETFNVGSNDQQFTKRMLVDMLLSIVPEAQVEIREGSTDPRNYRVSFDKIRRAFGFHVEETVEEHLPQLVAAIRSGAFPKQLNGQFGNFEVDGRFVSASA